MDFIQNRKWSLQEAVQLASCKNAEKTVGGVCGYRLLEGAPEMEITRLWVEDERGGEWDWILLLL